MKIAISNICTAFSYGKAIGSRVNPSYEDEFLKQVEFAIERKYTEGGGVAPPVMVLRLPEQVNRMVRCGVGTIPTLPGKSDFVVREFRGRWSLYLHPRNVCVTKCVDVVVYKKHEYDNDPDSTPEEKERTKDADFVIVAVLARASTEPPPYGSTVLVHNIAGGNNAFKPRFARDGTASRDDFILDEKARLYDWFVKLARDSEFAEEHYKTVADAE